MRKLLQLAAALTLTAPACAQITKPDILVAPPPRNPARSAIQPAGDYQWLWQYTKPAPTGNKHDLAADPRFPALLADNFKAPQAMWGMGVPLNDAARLFLSGEGAVTSADNRHLTLTGCVIDHCEQRGLLYADLGARDPLLVFAALRWNEQAKTVDQPNAPYTLWLFPARALDPQNLPEALQTALRDWSQPHGCLPYQIVNAIVVDPTGVPHIIAAFQAGVSPNPCAKYTGNPL